jgi:hypothetical protein
MCCFSGNIRVSDPLSGFLWRRGKSARCTCGYRVFVCSHMALSGDLTPVLAKHSKSFSLIDCISVGVDRCKN